MKAEIAEENNLNLEDLESKSEKESSHTNRTEKQILNKNDKGYCLKRVNK